VASICATTWSSCARVRDSTATHAPCLRELNCDAAAESQTAPRDECRATRKQLAGHITSRDW
jgi:hypothetical protein